MTSEEKALYKESMTSSQGVIPLASSGSLSARGPHMALLLISIVVSSAGAVDESGADVAPNGLFRIEDGLLIIDWWQGAAFSLDFPGGEGDLRVAEEENVSSDLNSTTSPVRRPASSLLVGAAHLGWSSGDPRMGGGGRHEEYGRKATDLVGIFSIEMNIKLGSDPCPSPGSPGWMACP